MKKISFTAGIGLIFFLLSALPVKAGTLTNASDTISNSRPSAIANIGVGASSGSTKLNLSGMDTNNARFIAGDSAIFFGAPGTQETINIASMSAVIGNTAAIYLSAPTTQSHNVGATVMMSSTAQHKISFRTVTPVNGSIQITLPKGNVDNKPSYDGFSFNGLASGDLSATGATCSSWTITPAAGTIKCNLGVAITAPTDITINIGLNNTSPVLVNPAKTNNVGNKDSWTIRVATADNDGTEKDSAKVAVATIEAVEVYATVEPYINFSIQGIADDVAVGDSNPGCVATGKTNTGIPTSATEVNLGVLGALRTNIAAQLLTIATNAKSGYTLTATSSGHLADNSIGYWLADAQGNPTANNTPAPAVIANGTTAFGIFPCGQDVAEAGVTWETDCSVSGTAGTAGDPSTCKYANPAPAYYYTLAKDGDGPIGSGSTDGANDGLVTIVYGATISSVVPAGTYRTYITYVATPTF